jgi:hypothetical protein
MIPWISAWLPLVNIARNRVQIGNRVLWFEFLNAKNWFQILAVGFNFSL